MLALGKLDFIYRFSIAVYSLFPISTKIFIKRDNCPFFRLLRISFDAAPHRECVDSDSEDRRKLAKI